MEVKVATRPVIFNRWVMAHW